MIKKVGVAGGIAATVGVLGAAPAYAAADPDAIGAGTGNGLYDAVIKFAASTPSWMQSLGAAFTKAGLLIIAVLYLVTWWRARGRGPGNAREVALAILAPLATGVAYIISEVVKTVVGEDRPCRGLPGTATVVECPAVGDWSMPSNHATIAAAGAVGLIFAWRKLMPWVVGIALLMAFSRVFVGVHYPHDVLIGLVLGAVVAAAAVYFSVGVMTNLVERFTGHSLVGKLLTAEAPARAEQGERAATRAPSTRQVSNPAERPTEQLRRPRQGQPMQPQGRPAPRQAPNVQEPMRHPRQNRPADYGYGDPPRRPGPPQGRQTPPDQNAWPAEGRAEPQPGFDPRSRDHR